MTPLNNGPQDIDYHRALRLLLFTNPDPGVDTEGVNAIFAEIGGDARAGQALLALADLAHMHAPTLQSLAGVEAIRRTLAQYEAKLLNVKEDNDE